MARLGHVILAGSLLMGTQAFAQTVPVSAPIDKVTINSFTVTAAMSSKVGDIVAPTRNPNAPVTPNESVPAIANLITPQADERRYNMAVEKAREQVGGLLLAPIGNSNGIMGGVVNSPYGGAALGLKGSLNINDATGTSKGRGIWEASVGENKSLSISARFTFK